MKNLLIYLVLKACGWSRCKLSDGSPGWERRETEVVIQRGTRKFALAHLERESPKGM